MGVRKGLVSGQNSCVGVRTRWSDVVSDRPEPLAASSLEHTLNTAMSTPTTSCETYPGHDYSLPQLLYATKRKLQHAALGGR